MAASSLVFLVVTLLIGSFTIVSDASRKNSREEYGPEEIEKQLKAINKPAIKSFTAVPNFVSKRNNAPPLRFECPHGTVIIKRSTKQDLLSAHKLKVTGFGLTNANRPNGHHSAGVGYRAQVSEASGRVNVWSPPHVSPRQFSLARVLVSTPTNSIQAGWQVNPAQYTDTEIRFYTYWTADGYKKRGCFDMHCPGFVQVSKTHPLGTSVDAVSTRDRFQIYIDVTISREPNTGDWWLFYETVAIGYWPRELFSTQGLAQVASWRGEVYSPIGEKSPPMGSGSLAQDGFKRAACVNTIKVRDALWTPTKPVGMKVYADQPRCYNAKYVAHANPFDSPWNSAVFFGGPGGC